LVHPCVISSPIHDIVTSSLSDVTTFCWGVPLSLKGWRRESQVEDEDETSSIESLFTFEVRRRTTNKNKGGKDNEGQNRLRASMMTACHLFS
jgi:hypothetical protein